MWVYAAQPREGTETGNLRRDKTLNSARFMQLNPARGRKPMQNLAQAPNGLLGLCSSTPRGDGNRSLTPVSKACVIAVVYAAQPREGTETHELLRRILHRDAIGLCSSTPRGDGNKHRLCEIRYSQYRFMQLNPARGRKRVRVDGHTITLAHRGLCSSTPRGDGNSG